MRRLITRGKRAPPPQERMIDALVQLVHMRHTDSYDRVNVVLSLVATIFLPLTFVTGVYGDRSGQSQRVGVAERP